MNLKEIFTVLPQYILPQHGLSVCMSKLTHCRNRVWKNLFIKLIIKLYGVNLNEAKSQDLDAYPSFNDFFTRELKPGARSVAAATTAIASPADGVVSQAGRICDGRILQAKGHDFTALELLGGDIDLAKNFENGSFATIYLSPKDYHRLHMPINGDLLKMLHIPGRLFSVNAATCNTIPRLFARNERVVCLFNTDVGPMALILVGAIFVSSIETIWHGVVTPPTCSEIQSWDYAPNTRVLSKGDEMGRFNMGSTIIVMFGKDAISWNADFQAGKGVQLGESIGSSQPV